MFRSITLRCPKPPGRAAGLTPKVPPLTPKKEYSPENPPPIKSIEHETPEGNYEVRPPHLRTGHAIEYAQMMGKHQRDPPPMTEDITAQIPRHPMEDHHPHFDYRNRTGHRDGFLTSTTEMMDIKLGKFALYHSCLQSIPIVKHFYMLNLPAAEMKRRIRKQFEKNAHIKDPEAIRMLLYQGWMDYKECATMRKTKGSMFRMFSDRGDFWDATDKMVIEDEKKRMIERAYITGDYSTGGPYDGFWSADGKCLAHYYEMLKGRVPKHITTSKNFFHPFKPDGTQVWERNMDYEGWWVKNVDPDKAAARKELAGWVAQGYIVPKYYSSKNRRMYRRMVKDLQGVLNDPYHESYAKSRDMWFQMFVREDCPEANRLYAEKKLALLDDEILPSKMDLFKPAMNQALREFPNPRMTKTDVFYFRLRQLMVPLEDNWAKAPVGIALEKGLAEWLSDEVNFAISTSQVFQALKSNPVVNPMARTWADFYDKFDPDVPETRKLPWYHAEYDYDRLKNWDEYCMRKKKWVRLGDIDFTRPFFQALVHENEQFVNRADNIRTYGALERRYTSPRLVQLYRNLDKRMDLALANQIRSYANIPANVTKTEDVQTYLEKKVSWKDFKFQVPVVIYPFGAEQPELGLDGMPLARVSISSGGSPSGQTATATA
eukprot:PhF_6_TR41284/c0_g1_i1/m.62447